MGTPAAARDARRLDERSPARASRALWVSAAAIGFATFLLRLGTAQFPIDHFVHLTGGLMIVHGELPWRDFLDAGRPLQYMASAAAIRVFGPDLLGEALLCSAAIALASAVQFMVMARLSRSMFLSFVFTCLTILAFPRLYSYPKLICYALAVAIMLRLVERPGWRMAAALGLITGLSLLLRADHGVYIGLACLVLAVVARLEGRPVTGVAVAAYVAAFVASVLPYAVFVHLNGGLADYAAAIAEYRADNRRYETIPPDLAYGTLQFPPQITADLSAPLAEFESAPVATQPVGISWKDDLTPDERLTLEARYGLLNGRFLGNGQWEYDSAETTPDKVRALALEPSIENVTHVDLETGEVTSAPRQSLLARLYDLVPILRLRILPGLINASNAVPFLFYLALLIPFAALGMIIRRLAIAGVKHGDAGDVALPLAITVLCLLALIGMLRVPVIDRLPDVLPMSVILAAWLYGELLSDGPVRPPDPRWGKKLSLAGLALTLVLSMMSIMVISSLPNVTATKLRDMRAGLGWLRGQEGAPSFPLADSAWMPEDHHGASAITEYLRTCLRPNDRVLLTWYAPDIPYAADRLPAGDQVFILPGFWSSLHRQYRTLERMLHQSVPVVIARSSRYRDFRLAFDVLDMHIMERYRLTRELTPPNSPFQFRVYADPRSRQTGSYPLLDLPCFS